MPFTSHVICALLALSFVTGCIAPGPSPDPGSTYRGPVSLVALTSRPLSWEKLEGLEQWLDQNSTKASKKDVINARLELADGRAFYARRDQTTASSAVLKMRRDRAIGDYKLVLGDSRADSSQRARAQTGIANVGGTYTGSASYNTTKASGGGTSLSVISRAQWGADREAPDHMTAHKAPWSDITVHHSAMPLGYDTSLSGRAAELQTIQTSHLNKRNPRWGDVGYHYLIDPEGRIYEGRRLAWRGAHVAGLNDHKIGICLLGNFEVTKPTAASLSTLGRLLDDLRSRNNIPRSRVSHHTALASAGHATECPGRNLIGWVQNYRGGSSYVAAPRAVAPRTNYSVGTVR
jgi:hypothetical protein